MHSPDAALLRAFTLVLLYSKQLSTNAFLLPTAKGAYLHSHLSHARIKQHLLEFSRFFLICITLEMKEHRAKWWISKRRSHLRRLAHLLSCSINTGNRDNSQEYFIPPASLLQYFPSVHMLITVSTWKFLILCGN